MKYSIIILSIVLFILITCKVDLRQFPTKFEIQKIDNSIGKPSLYIGSFHINGIYDKFFNKEMEKIFVSFLESKRYFNKITLLPLDKNLREQDYHIVDIDIDPVYKEKIFWWLTWPAIYPFSGFWPIQIISADFHLSIRVKIYDKSGLRQNSIEVDDSFQDTIVFYGFYRTSPFERRIQESYKKTYYQIATKLSDKEILTGNKQ
ncbi:MAG: hypothetical protein H7A23_26865 [Leptospiraceae bacterium]|nr:hypothetical protein [Leptospiraceae bacterium]MCP5498193.1 hypothetical protein [Leptospiraceae bacterium]